MNTQVDNESFSTPDTPHTQAAVPVLLAAVALAGSAR
jgi:hypothetical protein